MHFSLVLLSLFINTGINIACFNELNSKFMNELPVTREVVHVT